MTKIKKIIKEISSVPARMFCRLNKNDYCDFLWIHKATKLLSTIRFIFPNYSFDLLFHSHILKIKKWLIENDCGVFSTNLLIFYDNDCSEDEKMFIINLLLSLNIMSESISKKIVSFAKSTSNKNYRYWITMNIEKGIFFNQKGLYKDYYLDRRDLMRQIAIENGLHCTKNSSLKQDNSICIVTYLLDKNLSNSMQRVASMFCHGLSNFYDKVYVLSLETFSSSRKDRRRCSLFYRRRKSSRFSRLIQQQFGSNVRIYYTSGHNYSERMQNSLEILEKINPSIIIDISDEFSAQSYCYNSTFKTFYFSLRGYSSSSFFDYYLCPKSLAIESNLQYRAVAQDKMIDWLFPEYVPLNRNKVERSHFNLINNAFIVVSIGINGDQFSSDFIDCFCPTIEKENLIWIFVGGGAPSYLKQKYPSLLSDRKIIEWGNEPNLFSLCSCCDAVIRPNTTGGSGGTAIAAMSGLPIVMSSFICDPMRWLGRDYSTLTTSQEMVDLILKLKNNPIFYSDMRKKTIELVNNVLNSDAAWKKLHSFLSNPIDKAI